jgi:hypothetical protein
MTLALPGFSKSFVIFFTVKDVEVIVTYSKRTASNSSTQEQALKLLFEHEGHVKGNTKRIEYEAGATTVE